MAIVEKVLSSKYTLWIILVFHFVIWFSVFMVLDVHPDMADHWIWSRYLSFGYYEHPPFVALTMRLISILFNDIVFGLKLGSVLFSVLILYLAYMAANEFFDRKTALAFVLLLESTPYFSIGSVFWHIDQPYMAFWLVCLYAIAKYINQRNANWMLLFGVAAGLGGMSKYIMILLPMGMLAWIIVDSAARKLLLQWQTYMGGIIAFLIIAPNIYWNSQHDWITFGFVLDKGLKNASFGVHFLHFIVSQLFLFSIIYSLYFWWHLFRKNLKPAVIESGDELKRQKWNFLLYTGLTSFLFFTFTSFLGSRTDPHWVNVSYFSFFLILAKFITGTISHDNNNRPVALFFSSLAINYLLLAVVLIQIHFIFIPIQFSDAPALTDLAGWRKSSAQIKQLCQQSNITVPPFVISREYQLSSALGLYMENQPLPHSIEKKERNLWSPVPQVKRKGALLVCPPTECQGVLKDSERRFGSKFRYLGEILTVEHGKILRKLKVFYLKPGS